jgi:hypothetical protein
MPFPNFRDIYQESRSPEEERRLSNEAAFKLLGFFIICVAIIVGESRL